MDKINFRALEDDNEHFLGIELNAEKMAKLNEMRGLCAELADKESGIRHRFRPFTDKDRHGSVALELKSPVWTFNLAVTGLLSQLFEMADGFAAAIVEGTDTIRLTFDVRNMWTKHGYDNDMEHGK